MELRGAGVVVTGASEGLGLALSEELARQGARVLMVARRQANLEEAVERIRRTGAEVSAFPADVGDKRAIHAMAGVAEALVGPVELVIHNASTLGHVPLRLLLDTDCEELERALAVNLVGPFRLTKALAGPMVLRGRGAVVSVTSDASVAAYPKWGAYGVSKAALDHLGRIWGAELCGTGVKVVTVDPGEMDTRMHADAMPEADRATLLRPEEAARRILAMIAVIETVPDGARVEAATWAQATAAGVGTGAVAGTGDARSTGVRP